jgi:DNA mismatch repair protein MutL
MTVQQASSQQLLFPLICFSATEMELIEELKLALVNTGFVLKTLVKIMLSFLVPSKNVTESEVSLVLEQLLSDLHDGIRQ